MKTRSDCPWRFLPYTACSAAENMAFDEALFRLARLRPAPTLRVFGWNPAAVSLGYFQDIDREIDAGFCRREGIDIVRRPTGGKAVLHDRELTYSLVASSAEAPFSGDILETYRVISACLVETLKRLGLNAELAPEARSAKGTPQEGYCFSVPSKYELLVNGRKICGSAQVRTAGAVLQHGSLLIDLDPTRVAAVMNVSPRDITETTTTIREQLGKDVAIETISGVLRQTFQEVMGIVFEEAGLSGEEEALKSQLLNGKYSSDLWNLEGKTAPGPDSGQNPAE